MIHLFKTLILVVCCTAFVSLSGQEAFDRVYAIFQQKCIQCHSNNSSGGLDLRGQASDLKSRKDQVHQALVNKASQHPKAANPLRVLPGRVDQSFLYRKVNKDFDTFPAAILDPLTEGELMPPYGHTDLTPRELEEMRQWILFGAPRNGNPYDASQLDAFYAGQALLSFPEGPPQAPLASEGTQIRMGPFYIAPAGEKEFFQKHSLQLPFDAEVDRIDVFFGNFSHHFLLYDFDRDPGNSIPPGLRTASLHQDVSLVMAFQSPESLRLPPKTAFFWEKDIVLDLNTHYINYSGAYVYQAEVYINVYYKERGNALHEMRTSLIPKTDIVIPNNGQTLRFEQTIANPALGNIYVWAMAGHTHRYGKSYKVYERRLNGSKGPLLYDGSCPGGIPGCQAPYFDYQHIPFRLFDTLMPLDLRRGFVHEATFLNDGPDTVRWGPTSADEMMLVVMSYVLDTTGIYTSIQTNTEIKENAKVYPNPTNGIITIDWPTSSGVFSAQLYDWSGQLIFQQKKMDKLHGTLHLQGLPNGVYTLLLQELNQANIQYHKIILTNSD